MSEAKMVSPYCGGCGHRFYGEPPIPEQEASEKARDRRCHYCTEDEKVDEKETGRCQRTAS